LLDDESKKIVYLRGFAHRNKPLIRGLESDVALINTFVQDNKGFMVGKNTGLVYEMSKPYPSCNNDFGHRNMSCSSCHTAWAPQCIGCHNQFDPASEGYDLLDNKFVTGEWVEYVGVYLAEAPTLGVRENESREIQPAIPGMVLTIDPMAYPKKGEIDSTVFMRLFAPVAPHTTAKEVRDCRSCHNDPVAIGYGRGDLAYQIMNGMGKWTFKPAYTPNRYDHLPEDAWIGFLTESGYIITEQSGLEWKQLPSTRTDFRPFTLKEQQSILTVGACLTCHSESSEVMRKSLEEPFESFLEKISDRCILPQW
jgi:hypothetical protein